jgi:hypothetical protein
MKSPETPGRGQAMKDFFLRTIRAMKVLARDERIPKPLRAIAAIGLLPIPGPVDEAILILIAPIFLLLYRTPMREAWTAAAQAQPKAAPEGAASPSIGKSPENL